MKEIRKGCLYTETNEWVKVEQNVATVGIDDYSQNEFGEIVFVDLPKVGQEFSQEDEICVVESVKTASDVCTPVSGTVVAVNDKLVEMPNLINSSCYDNGWLYKIEISKSEELDTLITADDYKNYIS